MCLFGSGGGSSAPIRNVAERTDANAVPNTNTPQQDKAEGKVTHEVGGASSGTGKFWGGKNDRAY